MRITLQPAYILHSRPYRDSSLLLEVFTAEHGRISLVGRGSRRRARGGSTSALLQPFKPLLISFTGRGELKTLTGVEAVAGIILLRGNSLYSGLYLNELLHRLLHRHDPYPELFARYGQALEDLSANGAPDGTLRQFEFSLLNDLGYGFDLAAEGGEGKPIQADGWYHYDSDYGMVPGTRSADPSRPAFFGADLLQMAAGQFEGDVRLTAKRLMRQALAIHLGVAPLMSRELFRGRRSNLGISPDAKSGTGETS